MIRFWKLTLSLTLITLFTTLITAEYFEIDGHVLVLKEQNFHMAIEAHEYLFVELCKLS